MQILELNVYGVAFKTAEFTQDTRIGYLRYIVNEVTFICGISSKSKQNLGVIKLSDLCLLEITV